MNANHYLITVTKNSINQLKVDVAEHEIPILQEIHGYENVLNFDAKMLKEGLGEPTRAREIDDTEYDRMCHKYGYALVEKCIGSKNQFMKMFQPKPTRRAKEASTTE